jgi:hypothetical protein
MITNGVYDPSGYRPRRFIAKDKKDGHVRFLFLWKIGNPQDILESSDVEPMPKTWGVRGWAAVQEFT